MHFHGVLFFYVLGMELASTTTDCLDTLIGSSIALRSFTIFIFFAIQDTRAGLTPCGSHCTVVLCPEKADEKA